MRSILLVLSLLALSCCTKTTPVEDTTAVGEAAQIDTTKAITVAQADAPKPAAEAAKPAVAAEVAKPSEAPKAAAPAVAPKDVKKKAKKAAPAATPAPAK